MANKQGRRLDPTSRRAIAERLTAALGVNVTQRMVRNWQELGFPVEDVEALRRELDTLQRPPGEEDGTSAGSLREQILKAELRRKLASADRMELEAARARDEVIDRASVVKDFECVGRNFRLAHDKLANDLPPMLAGRSAGEVQTILKREFKAMLENLAQMEAHRNLEEIISKQP